MSEYRICKRCIMDTSDPDITFDERGYCNHCIRDEESIKRVVVGGEEGENKLKAFLEKIKSERGDNKYDCLIGLSGGLDSSYLTYLLWKNGVNPLVVLLDNKWDPPETTENVKKILEKTGFDTYHYEFNMEEYYDLQKAYLRSSVPNIEIVFDHAIQPLFFRIAKEHKLKYVLAGFNVVGEGIVTPAAWTHSAADLANLKDIHKKFGKVKLKDYPMMNPWKGYYLRFFTDLTYVFPLNWISYNREDAMKIMQDEFDYEYYGEKHFENVFTRFYQAYIVPTKFKVDKRRQHFSSLIMVGQMTREEALAKLDEEYYPQEMFEKDYERVLKQLNMTKEEFEEIMALPPKSHRDYKTWKVLPFTLKILRKIRSIITRFR